MSMSSAKEAAENIIQTNYKEYLIEIKQNIFRYIYKKPKNISKIKGQKPKKETKM